jgi:hypothetical protein
LVLSRRRTAGSDEVGAERSRNARISISEATPRVKQISKRFALSYSQHQEKPWTSVQGFLYMHSNQRTIYN